MLSFTTSLFIWFGFYGSKVKNDYKVMGGTEQHLQFYGPTHRTRKKKTIFFWRFQVYFSFILWWLLLCSPGGRPQSQCLGLLHSGSMSYFCDPLSGESKFGFDCNRFENKLFLKNDWTSSCNRFIREISFLINTAGDSQCGGGIRFEASTALETQTY